MEYDKLFLICVFSITLVTILSIATIFIIEHERKIDRKEFIEKNTFSRHNVEPMEKLRINSREQITYFHPNGDMEVEGRLYVNATSGEVSIINDDNQGDHE